MRILSVLLIASAVASARPATSPRVRMMSRGALAFGADGTAGFLVRADSLPTGLDARRVAPGWHAVRTDAAGLAQLLAHPAVRRVEEQRTLHTLLDHAAAAVNAPAARMETGLDGTGALVAVVDTGADFRHADLRDAAGHSRIAALVDASQPDDHRHPELSPPFAVWTAADLDAILAAEAAGQMPPFAVPTGDTDGHGTHVSACAASSGLATGNSLPAHRYVGIAPGAQLVVVKANSAGGNFTDANVLAGVQFALDFAQRVGRPVAVNLSLGAAGGPHDGTSALEEALDAQFPPDQPGRALVVAAGNDGQRDQHAAALAVTGRLDLPIVVPSAATGALSVEVYSDGPLTVSLESPKNAITPAVAPGKTFSGMANSDTVNLDDASGGPEPSGRSRIALYVQGPPNSAPGEGTWTLHLTGTAGRLDAWIVDSPLSRGAFADHIAEDDRLEQPATARNAIVVGSFVSRSGWNTVEATTVTRPITPGRASSFSAPGPTADGRFAPDVIAPGEYVVAALSSATDPSMASSAFYVPSMPKLAIADDGVHGVLRGTSQAAPLVAGAAALLFQADPTLTPRRLRERLRVSAHEAGAGFSPRQGFGQLDVEVAARYAQGARGSAVSASRSSVGVSRDALAPGGDITVVTVTPRDETGLPLGAGHMVTIDLSAGDAVGPVADTGEGRYERAFRAHAPRGTVATVHATADGVALAGQPSVWFVLDRSEIGSPFHAGGGCDVEPAPHGAAAVLALLFALAVNSRRRRRPATLRA